jgi:hypothetical protein
MFGKLLSLDVKVVTLPVDIGNATIDNMTGGDMSSRSRNQIPISGDLAKIRDQIAKDLEELDK